MRHFLPVILLASALLVGCAGPGPFTMTCSALGRPAVAQPGQQIDLGDFSVAAPKGEGWCFAEGLQGAAFAMHPLMGQYIEKPERSMAFNTVAMAAVKLRHGGADLENTDELQQFVEEWIKRGFGLKGSQSEPIVGDQKITRVTLVRSMIRPRPSSDAVCVGYDFVMEERDNPHAPDIVLIVTDHGVICQHPNAPDYLVWMSLSERYERGNQIDPSLFQKLKSQEAGPFFESLKFAQTG